MKFIKGDFVVQTVAPPIKGQVLGFGFDETTGEVSIKVEYKVGEETQQREFKQSEFELQTPNPEPEVIPE
jgi:hypothetical protein